MKFARLMTKNVLTKLWQQSENAIGRLLDGQTVGITWSIISHHQYSTVTLTLLETVVFRVLYTTGWPYCKRSYYQNGILSLSCILYTKVDCLIRTPKQMNPRE